MLEALKEILHKTVPAADTAHVTPETRLKEDLGLTSFDFLVIMVEIEDEYGVTLGASDVFDTVGDVMDFLKRNSPKFRNEER